MSTLTVHVTLAVNYKLYENCMKTLAETHFVRQGQLNPTNLPITHTEHTDRPRRRQETNDLANFAGHTQTTTTTLR